MKLASGIAPVAAMIEAGISVSLGTDGCASNNNLDMFEEMKIAALLQKVATGNPTALPARQVLEMATVNGARALGVDSGMLRPGMNADVIVVDMNRPHLLPAYDVPSHLVYAASGRDVTATIVDGRILMENGRVTSVDEETVLDGAAGLSRGLPFR
jgi:5-methylthioadenosine/S-adenosylhomocysteine deaminase